MRPEYRPPPSKRPPEQTLANLAVTVDVPGIEVIATTPAEERAIADIRASRRAAQAPMTTTVATTPRTTARPRGGGRPAARRTAGSSSGGSSDSDDGDPGPGEPAPLARTSRRHIEVREGPARAGHRDRALDDALDDPPAGPAAHSPAVPEGAVVMPGFTAATLDYFNRHAIDPEVAHALGVRNGAEGVTYPCVDANGRPTLRVRRLNGAEPKVVGEAGAPLGVTVWRAPKAGGMVLVCEGESDALAACSARPDLAVASVPGVGFAVDRLATALYGLKVAGVVLALDSDRAGDAFASKAARAISQVGIQVRLMRLEHGQDLSDALAARQHDERAEWLAQAIREGEPVEAVAPAELPFVSAAELRTSTPVEPVWLWTGYLAPGAVMMLAGRPKSGKSTLACALIEAVALGAPTFLGREIVGGRVVYVAEEAAGTLAHKLPATERVRVLTRDAVWPRPAWPALVAGAVEEAKRIGAVLLVIDALAHWAGFAEGQEKDAGSAQAAMDVLTAATRSGLAVALVHHQRKAGGEDGDAVRGSGALFGAVDLLVELERDTDAAPGQRRLVGTGRWTSTPAVLIVEREPERGVWRVIGEASSRAEVGEIATRERVLATVPPEWPGATETEIAATVGGSKQRAGEALRGLLAEGVVERVGKGAKGDPYCYRKCPPRFSPGPGGESSTDPPRALSGFSPHPVGGENQKAALSTLAQCSPVAAGGESCSTTIAGPGEPRLEDALDELAADLDGTWTKGARADVVEHPPLDLDAYRRARASYVAMDGAAMALDKPTAVDYWRTGPGHPGTVLDDDERERMLDAQPDHYVSAKRAAELAGITPSALAALWRSGALIPEIGLLPSMYRAIAEPAAPRPSTWYLRSSVERFTRRSPASRGEVTR